MGIVGVFLSSTTRDLAQCRERAYRAIEGLAGYHCVRMEDFSAAAAGVEDYCRQRVSECELFVGLVGHLRGSCPEGSRKSYTEIEFEAAEQGDLARLLFVAGPDYPIPAHLIEPDTLRAQQRQFRERVLQESVCHEFSSADDLSGPVAQAIRNWELSARRDDRFAGILPPRSLRGSHILIVDDDEQLADAMARKLLEEGFEVTAATTGSEALEILSTLTGSTVDLVLLDLMLPDIDGTEVCSLIRAKSPVPIVMVTARSEEVDRILGLELGADDYITKPFAPREMVARVRAVLRRVLRLEDGRSVWDH